MFFSKLEDINNEIITIMDAMSVHMKEFAVKIDDVILDKYTQDSRILKLKLWDHFKQKILLSEVCDENS